MKATIYHDDDGNVVGAAVSTHPQRIPIRFVGRGGPEVRAIHVDLPSALHFDDADPSRIRDVLNRLMKEVRIGDAARDGVPE